MKRTLLVAAGMACLCVAVSAQNLEIDFRYNVRAADPDNFLTFRGPDGSVERDSFDAVSGASRHGSTYAFNAYRQAVDGSPSLPVGLRGLLLYAVAADGLRAGNNVSVTRARNGVITVQHVHRGVAYRIVTDEQGRLSLPDGDTQMRVVGAQPPGAGTVQIISRDFSPNNTAARINWGHVWNPARPHGSVIPGVAGNRTAGPLQDDRATSAERVWTGALQFGFEGNILTVNGTLRPQ